MDLALRPMSTSQILDRTFQLYRRNFVLFAGIAALPPALLLLGQALLFTVPWLAARMPATLSSPVAAGIAAAGTGVLYVVLYFVGYCLATGANVFAVSRTHLGKSTTIGESYREIGPHAWNLIKIVVLVFMAVSGVMLLGISGIVLSTVARLGSITGVIVSLVSSFALIICIIWGARLSLSFAVAPAVCVIEKSSALTSLRRSRVLTKGALGRIFLISLLAGVIAAALSATLNIPVFVATAAAAAAGGKVGVGIVIWQLLAGFVAGVVAGPIATISIALIYYDQRVRKEAFDLQLMMEAVGMQQPAQAQAQAAGTSPAPGIG